MEVASGRYKDARTHYDACLASKAEGPGLASLKRDALTNRRFAERLIPPPTSPDPEGNRKTPDSDRPGESPPRPPEDGRPKDSPTPPDTPNEPSPGQGEGPKGTGGQRRPGESGRERNPPSPASMRCSIRSARRRDRREAPSASGPAKTDRKDW